MVRERSDDALHNLSGLMTLACDQKGVPRSETPYSLENSGTTIADIRRTRRRAPDRRANERWILRARVVVSDDDVVGKPTRHISHHRTLRRIAIPAASEHEDKAPAHVRTDGSQQGFKSVRSMSIVDKDWRPLRCLAD
jgi:hypothetical protein